jgi:tRNA nucleotidyltransferase/poly(A) polymerase
MNYFDNIAEKIVLEAELEGFSDIVMSNTLFAKGISLCKEIEALGGSVRDLVLKKQIKDVDIATNVDLEKIEKHFKTAEIGKSKDFGIVLVLYKDEEFEVAHYRQEEGYSDNRRPDQVDLVKDFKGDSERRDFTFNAMGVNSDGEIIDHHDGLEDLQNGIIRTVGNSRLRFTEDALRILRLLRFAVKMGFEIEPETLQSAKELNHTVDTLSKERIADEFYKVAGISGPALAQYIEKLDEIGLLQKLLPELYTLKDMQHNIKHHPEGGGKVLGHILEALRVSNSTDALTNLAIAFHDVGKATTYDYNDGKHSYHGHEGAGVPIVKAIAKRLKLSNSDREVLEYCAANHMRIHKIYDMKKSKVVSMVNSPIWKYLKEVGYADEMCRRFAHSTTEDFEKKIAYAEGLAEEANKGYSPSDLKVRLKGVIDGNKLMTWIPELKQNEYKPLIGKILGLMQDEIIDDNLFEVSEDELRKRALAHFEKIN